MITPIKTMTINQIVERKDDLLMSDDDIKEMAKNVRAKAVEEFSKRLCGEIFKYDCPLCMNDIKEIAEEMRGAE